jgi:multidrug resistance efflux pump
MAQVQAAIGFRVKSGSATAVLVGGPADAPKLLDRSVVVLSDPAVPKSRQPYHAGLGVAQQDSEKLRRLIEIVERYTQKSVADLVNRYRGAGHRLRGAGLVVGSDIDPERIANLHIRAHASEGRLFRTVLEQAARRCDLESRTFVERNLFQQATRALDRPEADLKRTVTELGRSQAGPWRAEEKAAALAAWLVLAARRP